jgi:FkbM family methyltransferase
VLDIGANVGLWTKQFIDLFPQASVVMVEAQPELTSTLEALGSKHANVTAAHAVLAADASVRDFYVCLGDRHRSGSSLRPELTGAPLERRQVTTTTVDQLITSLDAPGPVDFLKIDTQGSELEILQGAERTLATVRFLQMEVSLMSYNEGAPLLAEVVAFMAERGFFAFDIFDLKYVPDTDDLMQFDCLFSRAVRSVSEVSGAT